MPSTRHPVSPMTTIDVSLILSTISFVTGTRSVPVDCAPDDSAPAVTGTPRWPSTAAVLAKLRPSA
jgi:hypothetical protein